MWGILWGAHRQPRAQFQPLSSLQLAHGKSIHSTFEKEWLLALNTKPTRTILRIKT